jgi:hypothetical protein
LKDSARKRRVLRNEKGRAKMLHHSVCVGTCAKGDAAVDDPFMLIQEASKKVESSPRINRDLKHKSNMTSSEVKNKGRPRLNATEANGME